MSKRRNLRRQTSPLPAAKAPTGIARFKPSRAQIVSGALIFSASLLTFAIVPALNTFTAGTPISASAVNANFTSLDTRTTAAETSLASAAQTLAAFGSNSSNRIVTADVINVSTGTCVLGEVKLFAGSLYPANEMMPAQGQLLPIAKYQGLFSMLGPTFGGDGMTTFALPDLRTAAPNNHTYMICVTGAFP